MSYEKPEIFVLASTACATRDLSGQDDFPEKSWMAPEHDVGHSYDDSNWAEATSSTSASYEADE